jgi:hypothetical protein
VVDDEEVKGEEAEGMADVALAKRTKPCPEKSGPKGSGQETEILGSR